MHFLQSKYWKEVKKNLGNNVYQVDNLFFQTTKLPFLKKYIGYIPRPDIFQINWDKLYEEALKANCVFVSIDPANIYSQGNALSLPGTYIFDKGAPINLQDNIIIHFDKPR